MYPERMPFIRVLVFSENARFAEFCEKCNVTFVGPGSEIIRNLGNKQVARNTMVAAGVPVIPGTNEPIYDVEAGAREAQKIGYPVIIKAALGGGGKRECVPPIRRRNSRWHFRRPRKRHRLLSVTERCIWNTL